MGHIMQDAASIKKDIANGVGPFEAALRKPSKPIQKLLNMELGMYFELMTFPETEAGHDNTCAVKHTP